MKMFKVPEQYRIQAIPSNRGDLFGAFSTKSPYRQGFILYIIACEAYEDSRGWEHVSVHAASLLGTKHTPNWEEMAYVKSLFWDDEATVVQFHPKKSEYVNNHNYVLHLWRHVDNEFELPPKELV